MDNAEARNLLSAELAAWRSRAYAELSALVGESQHFVRAGDGGTSYQLEIEVMWDARPQHDIRVIGSIDDGGWSAFKPLTQSFIRASSGEFVGEP